MGNSQVTPFPKSLSDPRNAEDIQTATNDGIRRVIDSLKTVGISAADLTTQPQWGSIVDVPLYFPPDVETQLRNGGQNVTAEAAAQNFAKNMVAIARNQLTQIFEKQLQSGNVMFGFLADQDKYDFTRTATNILSYFSAVVTLAAYAAYLAVQYSTVNTAQLNTNIQNQISLLGGGNDPRAQLAQKKLRDQAFTLSRALHARIHELLLSVDKTLAWLSKLPTPADFHKNQKDVYDQLAGLNKRVCNALYALRQFAYFPNQQGQFVNYFTNVPANPLPTVNALEPPLDAQTPCSDDQNAKYRNPWQPSLLVSRSIKDTSFVYPKVQAAPALRPASVAAAAALPASGAAKKK